MKILHISHVYYPSEGGVQSWYKNVSERLVRNYGDEVTIVTTNSMYGPERTVFKEIQPAEEMVNGVKIIRFPFERWHIAPFRFLNKAFAKAGISMPVRLAARATGPWSREMKRFLLHAQADAVCAGSSKYYHMQLPLWKPCNFFYFGSIHVHNLNGHAALNALQRKCVNASTAYLANTFFEKRKVEQAGIPAEKVKVLGVGVDAKDFAATNSDVKAFRHLLQIEDDALVIAYAGRIERTKNIKLLVDAFAKLASTHQKLYLIIAGASGDHAEELKAYIAANHRAIAAKVKWKINFTDREKPLLFHALDILVLPSNNESFGIVFLEAWICGKPVIGAGIGAVKDVIDDERNGFIFEPDSEAHLTKQLQRLVADASLRQQLGQNGYAKVQENYTWDIITRKLRQCYLEGLKQQQHV